MYKSSMKLGHVKLYEAAKEAMWKGLKTLTKRCLFLRFEKI